MSGHRFYSKIAWTPEQDALIKMMRAAGCSWTAIGAAVGYTRDPVRRHGYHIGAYLRSHQKRASVVKSEPVVADVRDVRLGRDALSPGHPISWGAITFGTLLEDTPYAPRRQ